MKRNSWSRRLVFLLGLAVVPLTTACEAILDFDRTPLQPIPEAAPFPEASSSGVDARRPDSSSGGPDARQDTGGPTPQDAGQDADGDANP